MMHTGWGGLGNQKLPDSVYMLQYVPHERIISAVIGSAEKGKPGILYYERFDHNLGNYGRVINFPF